MADIAAHVHAHAEKIIAAAGSRLRHYETQSKAEILAAVLDCYEEAYRAGAAFTLVALNPDKAREDKAHGE